ncbi:MAG: DUF2236 domain-containing protein [Acidimicrobiia bacterium]|nr:DUF2236 domain-containing protein [Acidimicrobiia bacterium]
MSRIRDRIDGYRDRVVNSTTDLFAHAPYPLANTLEYRGDPGLCGPESVTWPVIGDAAAFVGGIRALLIQAAHPEVVAGVSEHSRYQEDPLGRLSRTSAYVTATSFGAMPEVEAAVAVVRGAHRPVRGTSHRERPYSAGAPALAAWVHNALTDSFLEAFQVYGPRRLHTSEADRFVEEQTAIGRLLGADPTPATAAGLASWIADHPELGDSPGLVETVGFIRNPPLPWHVKLPYRLMYVAAIATLPDRVRRILGVRKAPGAVMTGRLLIGALRWALGSSPSWHISLVRVGAPVPDGLFRQALPTEGRIDEDGSMRGLES